MIIIGTEVKKFDGLFGANGEKLELVGEATPIVVKEEVVEEEVLDLMEKEEVEEMTEDEKILAEVARLQAELEALKNGDKKNGGAPTTTKKEDKGGSNVKKNQKPGKADATRKYERLGEFKAWGKVPQQQADLAAIITESVDLGAEWTEEELFDLVSTGAKDYASLRNSKQDPTYLFRYYRGLKNDGKHAGFVARGFLRMY